MNKITRIILCLSLLSLTVSCKTKVPAKSPDVIVIDGNDNTTEEIIIEEPEEIIEVEVPDTDLVVTPIDTIKQDSIIKKAVYKVAVVLPFMSDSVWRTWSNNKETNFDEMEISNESEVSASFMEGMLMALGEMKLNSKFNISVFDNKNSTEKNLEILETIKKDSFDLIIGPMKKSHLVPFTEYTSSKKIIHISPFSPSKSASMGNENYFMIEPSLEQHVLNMVDYGIDSFANPNIVFMYSSKGNGTAYGKLIENYLNTYNQTNKNGKQISYQIAAYDLDGRSLDKYLVSGKQNIAIIYSFDEGFIHSYVRQGANDRAIVFGMPGWDKSEVISLEHLNKYNFHFTQSWWINEEDSKVKNFKALYERKYQKEPTSDAFLGYDVAAIFFTSIDKEGLTFSKYLTEQTFNGLSRNYVFKKVLTSDNVVHRIENTQMNIYKIEDFERVLVK